MLFQHMFMLFQYKLKLCTINVYVEKIQACVEKNMLWIPSPSFHCRISPYVFLKTSLRFFQTTGCFLQTTSRLLQTTSRLPQRTCCLKTKPRCIECKVTVLWVQSPFFISESNESKRKRENSLCFHLQCLASGTFVNPCKGWKGKTFPSVVFPPVPVLYII